MRFIYATGERPLEGYTIKRGIGIGGFGQVYYAVSDAGKEVALKHIQRNLDVELRGVSQCLNLKHPNLLALYDIRYDEAGEGWVVMEYIAGESLRDVLDRNPNGMPHEAISLWLAGLAAGVACLHDNGIVHRDMKPGNVFNDGGIIKVGDYGLSKFISVSRRSAQTESVGTFHYMAPEIGRGRYGREIDIYALGIILHEMITGDVPFDGESSQEIIMKHLTAEPQLDGIAEPYRSVIARSLEKDPEKRLNSVPEMLRLLNIAVPTAGAAPVIAIAPTVPPIRSHTQSSNDKQPPADQPQPPDEPESLVIQDDVNEETIYIEDDVTARDDIEFGPVEHRLNSSPRPGNANPPNNPLRRQGPAPAVAALPQEPIAGAIHRAWQRVTSWFSNPTGSTPLKVVLLILLVGAGIPLALFNAGWLVPLLLVLGVAYALYYAVRAIILSLQSEEEDKRRHGNSEDVNVRHQWQAQARSELAQRSWPQQLSELTGSLIVSAVVTGVLGVVSMIIFGQSSGGDVMGWGPQLAWFALSAIAGVWAVLVAGKFYAARNGDQIMRRLTMLAIGLGVGLFSYGIATGLMLQSSHAEMVAGKPMFESLVDSANHSLLLPAYLAYFGGLLFILRWWIHADPLRSVRLSLWATGLAALWGVLLPIVFPFPQPWGVLLAITMAIAVQLAAPWVSKPERNRIRQQFRLQDAQGVRRA